MIDDTNKWPPDDENEDAENEEQFSEDPEEQLRMENELLRLKLQAETGAEMGPFKEVPPEVENAFLNHILAFEQQLDKMEEKSIFEILGAPDDFKNESELTDAAVNKELQRLEELMFSKNIEVDYGMAYADRVKYKFLTEELFRHKTEHFEIPNMMSHFIYEEFHPNHYLAIEELAMEFLNAWLQQDIDSVIAAFSDIWNPPDGKTLSQDLVKQKIVPVFDAYLRFENGSFDIHDLHFELTPADEAAESQGKGDVTGSITYDAILENGEIKRVSDDFLLEAGLHFDSWEITFARMPDLRW